MSQPLLNITRKHALIFAMFLVMYEFLTYIANDMIMPAMLQVVQSFGASESYVASSLSFYVFGGASLQLLLGPISDRFGRRPVMLFGVMFFLICTVGLAFSQTIHQYLVIRFFEGMGLCFIAVIGYAVIHELFAEMDAVRLIAIMTNIAVVAPLLGPLAGAYLSNVMGWQYIFIIIAAFCLIAYIGLWKFMPETVGQVKRDGTKVEPSDLSFKSVWANYKNLLVNPAFMLGVTSFGFLGICCVAWIGISPVILVTDANLSLIAYALWQIPVFSAFIAANLILIQLTYKFKLKSLAIVGCFIAFVGLVIMWILPMFFGNNYIWIMPGVIVYFFGFGLSASPIYRLTLYSTEVSKGTASALMSMVYMIIQGIGVEGANLVAQLHSNSYFGSYCAGIGIIFILIMIFNKKLKG